MLDQPAEFFSFLAQSLTLLIGFTAILGLMVGSFLNVVIHRMPKMLERDWHQQCQALQGNEVEPGETFNLSFPRSSCPNCGHQITLLENIPLLSYLLLGGKCSNCKTGISIRYPLVELLTGMLAGLVSWKFGYSSTTLFVLVLMFALIALTFIDFDTQLLPDDITLPLLWLGLLFNLDYGFTDLASAVIGAIAGYLSLWSIYWAFKLITGKEGMGYGDFKLLAALGAWFGWQMLPAIILLSSISGAIIGIGLITLTDHGREKPMPFGPFLAIAGIAALFFGQTLLQFYLP